MKKGVLSVKEICKKSFDELVARGYSPEYKEDDHVDFDCTINGTKFLFYQLQEDMFGFCAEFNLVEELSPDEQNRLGDLYDQTQDDDLVFENFHIDKKCAWLSSAFMCNLYPHNMIELSVRELERDDGIAAQLKVKSKTV